MKKTILILIGLVFVVTISAQAGSVMVIANKNVTQASLSKDECQQIFLGKSSTWPDGKKVVPVITKAGKTQEEFLKAFMGKTPSQYDAYCKQAIFTGTAKVPKAVGSETDVVNFVTSTDGAVGCIDSDTPHGDAKKIEVK